jgi:hypothetical protein
MWNIWFVNSYIAECTLSFEDYTYLGPPNLFLYWGPEISGTGFQVVNLLEKHSVHLWLSANHTRVGWVHARVMFMDFGEIITHSKCEYYFRRINQDC